MENRREVVQGLSTGYVKSGLVAHDNSKKKVKPDREIKRKAL